MAVVVRKLIVEVIDARNLLPKDGHGASSPYAVLDFHGQRRKTRTVIRDLNPSWNEYLEFNVGKTSEVFGDMLELDIFHDKNVGPTTRNNFLGRVKLSSSQFVKKGEEALIYYPLEKKSFFSWVQGEIGLKIYFVDEVVPPPAPPPPPPPPEVKPEIAPAPAELPPTSNESAVEPPLPAVSDDAKENGKSVAPPTTEPAAGKANEETITAAEEENHTAETNNENQTDQSEETKPADPIPKVESAIPVPATSTFDAFFGSGVNGSSPDSPFFSSTRDFLTASLASSICTY